ncbi:hypothetical protein T492DRAFT_1145817 [Pavlovales sp. CCMP2436]|nr:hypothetical protein T492DRAFT_1145817 [Pavlovales sp. CCMP2436]
MGEGSDNMLALVHGYLKARGLKKSAASMLTEAKFPPLRAGTQSLLQLVRPTPEEKKAKPAAKPAAAAKTDSSSDDSDDSSEEEKKVPVPTPGKRPRADAADAGPAAKVATPVAKVATPAAKGPRKVVMLTGLPHEVDEETVRSFLAPACDEVLEISMPNSRGIAFVSVAGEGGFQSLLRYTGAELDGKEVSIKEAVSGVPSGVSKLFVANLSFKTTEASLREAFSACGTVTAVRLGMDKVDVTKFMGWAHVEFDTHEEAQKGAALNGFELQGRPIRVQSAVPSEPSGGGPSGGPGRGGAGFGGSGFGGGRGTPGGRGGRDGGRGGGRGTPNSGRARGSGAIQDFAGKKMTFDD